MGSDVAQQAAKPGAQLAMMALELLGVGIAPLRMAEIRSQQQRQRGWKPRAQGQRPMSLV
jgi:hypothetical protein